MNAATGLRNLIGEITLAGTIEVAFGIIYTLWFVSEKDRYGPGPVPVVDNGGELVSLDTAMDLSIGVAVSADFNDNGVADFRDFLLFAEHFGMDDV